MAFGDSLGLVDDQHLLLDKFAAIEESEGAWGDDRRNITKCAYQILEGGLVRFSHLEGQRWSLNVRKVAGGRCLSFVSIMSKNSCLLTSTLR